MNEQTLSNNCILRDLESGKMAGSIHQEPQVMNDKLAHMFTSFAYCHTKTEREWFVQQETRIFKARFKAILDLFDGEKKRAVILETLVNLKKIYPPKYCPWEMVEELPQDFDKDSRKFLAGEYENTKDPTVTVPFEFCPLLIRRRLAYLHYGNAYTSLSHAKHLIYTSFSLFLHDALLSHKKLFPYLSDYAEIGDEDNEHTFIEFLQTASQKTEVMMSEIPTNLKNCLTLTDIYQLASTFQFPPCMRELHQELRKQGKLKNTGRLQYTLFLKEIGLSYENSYNLFQQEFMKKGISSVFLRDYVYGIKYNYGLEGGNREARREYSCKTIFQLHTPQGSELHGCPLKIYSKKELSKLFLSADIKKEISDQFLFQLEEGKFQETCRQFSLIKAPDISKTAAFKYIGIYPSAVVKALQELKTAKLLNK